MKAWTDVEASLHKRADLIPDLIDLLRIIRPNNDQLFSKLIMIRTKTVMMQFSVLDLYDSKTVEQLIRTQNDLSAEIHSLLSTMEKKQSLKENLNYMNIKNRIMDIENRIHVASFQYNRAVSSMNQSINSFPNNVTNKIFFRLKEIKLIVLNKHNC